MVGALIHNGYLMMKAESIINEFLSMENDEHHKTGCYIENPDGTVFKLEPGFKLHNYEYYDTFKEEENA